MPIAIYYILAGSGLFAAGGYFVDKTGEAATEVSNASLKLAFVGLVGFVALKKLKVI
jgi:hypothetical protein